MELAFHQARFSGLKIDFDLAPDLPLLQVNQNRLRQVFLALAINALEACSGQGRLTIRTLERASQAGSEVAIEFQDTGCGIAPELLERIFEPFFTTKGEQRGTGLGLAICHGIAQRILGGKLSANSVLDQGSCFTLSFPAQAPTGA